MMDIGFFNSHSIKIAANPLIKYFYNRTDDSLSSSRNSVIGSRLIALKEISKKLNFHNKEFYLAIVIRENSLSDYLIKK